MIETPGVRSGTGVSPRRHRDVAPHVAAWPVPGCPGRDRARARSGMKLRMYQMRKDLQL